jgi:hypothetical protein
MNQSETSYLWPRHAQTNRSRDWTHRASASPERLIRAALTHIIAPPSSPRFATTHDLSRIKMVDQIHQLKNQIWHAKQKVEKEEAKRLDWEQQVRQP